jgi:hypothetical protein
MAAAPNIGFLQSVSVDGTSTTTTYGDYDNLGRFKTHVQTIAGNANTYTLNYTYRSSGDLKTIEYPSGLEVAYDVDSSGRASKVYAGAETYADINAYTADGRIAQLKFGNDLVETRNFQTPAGTTVLMLGTTSGVGDMMELDYSYSTTNNNGNL